MYELKYLVEYNEMPYTNLYVLLTNLLGIPYLVEYSDMAERS